MDFGSLVSQHGYWLLALGCFLEGETVLLLAGLAARSGYLSPVGVLAGATVAAAAGDQCFYWIGRSKGPALLQRFPRLAGRAASLQARVGRHDAWLIVGLRFAWGMRVAGPVALGAMRVPAPRFAAFNLFGALLWAAAIGGLGWFAGLAAERILGDLRHLELPLFAAVAMAGTLAWWIRRRRAHPRPEHRRDGRWERRRERR
ncbi:MAG: DedA family protein [Burkholderiaceae bacterium]|nr:DedA family protein [Burkholderiaceae bacterium]